MSTYLTPEIQAGLDAARRLAKTRAKRLRVQVGEQSYPVLEVWPTGFALQAQDAPHLRGRVEIYDGARLLSLGLIVASTQDGEEIHCDYKQMSDVHEAAPLDFYRAPDAPTALIGSA